MRSLLRFCTTDTAQIFAAWVLSTALFAALITYISKHPHKRTLPLKIFFAAMFIGGTAMYCAFHWLEIQQVLGGHLENKSLDWVKSGNASALDYILYVIMVSVMDVGMMFSGRGNSTVFYNLPVSRNPAAVLLFWVIHLVAFYTAASALLIRFGNDLLMWLRISTSKISGVDLVFGVNSDSFSLGRNIADIKGRMLVYVDSVVREDYESSIRESGGVVCSGNDALKASPEFLRRIRIKPGGINFRLFALSDEYDKNMQYARNMSASLEKIGVLPEQTGLILLGTDEWKGMFFQAEGNQYGYGSVISFDEYEMSARLLMNKYPLCNAINFDADGRAAEDTDVLIVGFGRMGHEVLRQVIANGQFEGSSFHATVYDPNFEHRSGFLKSQYPNMFVKYNIDFEPQNARGSKIFRFMEDHAASLKYIAVCIEDRYTARDIAVHMVDRLRKIGRPVNVYTCDSKSVRCYSQNAEECAIHWIYDSDLLYSGELDGYARELNHAYAGGSSANEDWKRCAYFDRMSSRASVDYLIPLIRKIMPDSASAELTPEQRENLARSEHLRWCAFHYTFGYDVMDKEEFARRVKERQREITERGKSSIRPTKNPESMTHACLVDWDELDEISRIENSVTNGTKDYKDSDRGNVDMVMKILRAESEKAGKISGGLLWKAKASNITAVTYTSEKIM